MGRRQRCARLATAVAALVPAFALASCSDVSRFTTAPGESYCGDVVAASFVRVGIAEGTTMRLTLDADRLQDAPGTLTVGPLGAFGSAVEAPLEAIPQLANDSFSSFTFGAGRDKNALAVAHVGGVEVLVVLSLMQSGDVEARLLHGSPAREAAVPGDTQIFGVFQLKKRRGDCSSK